MSDIGARLHFDEGKLIVEHFQDVEPVLEANKIAQNAGDGYSPSRNMRYVASIPNVVYYDLLRKGIADDPKALRKWLNDIDHRKLRTSLGDV